MRVVVLVLVLALGAACGVGIDAAPRPLPAATLPSDFVEPPGEVPRAGTAARSVTLYFLNGDRLEPVQRATRVLRLRTALELLLAGPTEREQRRGLRSAVPPLAELLAVSASREVARIDLASSFADAAGQEQIRAVAQLVFTATVFEGVTGVRLLLDGNAVEVPRGDGTLARVPVTRLDYAEYAP